MLKGADVSGDVHEAHLVDMWLHELQDHTNLIAELPLVDPSQRMRDAFYDGMTQGLNANLVFYASLTQEAVTKMTATLGDEDVSSLAVLFSRMVGYKHGYDFREKLRHSKSSDLRQKMVNGLRDKLSKIAPWDDQTRKPL